jgi:hypothetical protein
MIFLVRKKILTGIAVSKIDTSWLIPRLNQHLDNIPQGLDENINLNTNIDHEAGPGFVFS